MKHRGLGIIVLVLLLSLFLGSCAKATTKVKVATDATWPPFETVDEATKKIVGFDIDLMDAIAKKAGFEVEYENVPFDTLLAGLSTCQYQVGISATTITEERSKSMLFSDPYMNAGQVVVINKSETGVKSKDDLAGKRVSAQLGTTGEMEAKKIAKVVYKPYDTLDLAMLDLANGQIDAVIADYPTAVAFVAANSEKLATVGTVFTDENYGVIFCKTNTDLQAKVNTALKALIAEGKIKEFEQKWLSASK